MKNQMKAYFSIVFVLLAVQLGYSQTTINLSSSDGGLKNYTADEVVSLLPGYHFVGNTSSQQMTAKTRRPVFENSGSQNMYSQQEFDNKTINTNLAVGTVAGAPSVSSTGAATYTIPIKIGKGTAGMEPSVSVVYNSQSGDGLLGKGWNLAGLSMISRVPRTIYHDGETGGVNLDYYDRYSIDGNRLVVQTGQYGAANSVYATESESFMRVTAKGKQGNGPEWFEVHTKDGLVLEFGRTSDSKLTGYNNVAIFWRVNKITDSNGNYMVFEYTNGGRDSRVSKIKYTGNSVTNLSTYNEIQFFYKERQDKNSVYISFSEVNSNYLLDRISTFSAGHLVRSYTFKYGYNKASYLTEVKESVASGEELNSTIFQYGDIGSKLTSNTLSSWIVNREGQLIPGDFNGDGREDILKAFSRLDERNIRYHTDYQIFYRDNDDYFYPGFGEDLPQGSSIVDSKPFPNGATFIPSDYNGDGIDDFLLSVTEYDGYNLSLDRTIIYFGSKEGNFSQISYDTPSNYSRISSKGHFLYPGDYDGDGATDFLTILSNGVTFKAFITFPRKSVVPIEFYNGFNFNHEVNADEIKVIDHNGDGRSNLMVIDGSETIVYSFENRQFDSFNHSAWVIYQGGFPTKWHKTYVGDFNGDGKTDLLNSAGDFSSWSVSLSNGYNYPLSIPVNLAKQYDISRDDLYVGDFNGDGKSDVMHTHDNSGTAFYDMYYSTGKNFVFERLTRSGHHLPARMILGDFYADGTIDAIEWAVNTSRSSMHEFNRDNHSNYLTAIKDGFGNINKFNYTFLSRSYKYNRGTTANYPHADFEKPLPIVLTSETADGIGGSSSFLYDFDEGIINKEGKGFLGFKKTVTTDYTQDIKSITENELNTTYATLVPTKQETQLLSNNNLISQSTSNYEVIPLGVKRYWTRMKATRATNLLTNSTTRTVLTYDTHGNITNSIVMTGDETITTTNEYIQYGPWIASLLTKQTVTAERGTEPAYTRVIEHLYDTKGNMTGIITDPGTAKVVSKTYAYDDYGNMTEEQILPAGLPVIETKYEYDPRGRHQIKVTNPLNQITEAVFDERWSKPTRTTGVDGFFNYFIYDNFGRLEETKDRKDLRVKTEYYWDLSTNGSGVKNPTTTTYRVEKQVEGAPKQITWFDAQGREVKSSVEGLDQTSFVVSKYNSKGQLISATEPFFQGATTVQTSHTEYDVYGRVVKTYTGDLENLISYQTVSGGGHKITTTSPSPSGVGTTVKSRRLDATGKVIEATDAGGTLVYKYYSDGNQKSVVRSNVTLAFMEYDLYGNQTKLIDANAGTTLYGYDALGQLIYQVDANNKTHTMTYDIMGRILTRVGPEGLTEYSYNTSGNGVNALKEVKGFNGVQENYTYDSYHRLIKKKEKIDQQTYTTSFEYDRLDQLTKTTYPSGYSTKKVYDLKGYLVAVTDGGGNPIYELPERNASGQLTSYRLGNGITTQKEYNSYGRLTNSYAGTLFSQQLTYQQNTSAITAMIDNNRQLFDRFQYDNLNRLHTFDLVDEVTQTAVTQSVVDYSGNGNISQKSGVGNYSYNPSKPNAMVGLSNNYGTTINPSEQNITYTPFDRTASITEGDLSLNFTYDANYDRKKTELYTNGQLTRTRLYLGMYEKTIAGNTTTEVHYIAGGDGVCAMHVIENGVGQTYYVYQDHLGSYKTITDVNGVSIAEQNYDAWGRVRDPETWSYTVTTPTPSWLYRGYTGHEMLPEFGLINMNNRMYDPVLGRMLAVDNFVQDPYSTQSYNRYSYVMNNPLSYVDPSGELVWFAPVIIGAVVGGYLGGAIQQGTWNPKSWDNSVWKGITVGAIAGAGLGLGASSIVAGLGGNITGIAGAGQVGFSTTGATTTAWNITSNALITGNINMVSSFFQGGNLEQIAVSGLIGVGSGAAGGIAGSYHSNASNVMSLKGIRAQNYITSTLSGSADRFYKSVDAGLSNSQIITNTILGGLEGFIMSSTVNSTRETELTSLNFLERVYINGMDKSTHAFSRYASSFISTTGTSIPGVGFQAGVVALTGAGAAYSAGNTMGAIASTLMFYGPITKLSSWALDKTGLWNSYEQIGAFRPYTVYGR